MDYRGIINILGNQGYGVGSGFFVSSYGHILTCFHVIKEIQSTSANSHFIFKFAASETLHYATLCAYDESLDIALLNSDIIPPVYYKLKTSIRKNEQLFSLGFPNGNKAGIPAEFVFHCFIENGKYIQLKQANSVTHGYSGSPIVNKDGFALGMITSISIDENFRMNDIAFATPSEVLINSFSLYFMIDKTVSSNNSEENIPTVEASDNAPSSVTVNARNAQTFNNSIINGGIHFD